MVNVTANIREPDVVHLQVQITQDPSESEEMMAQIGKMNVRATENSTQQDTSSGKAPKTGSSLPSSPGSQQVMNMISKKTQAAL